MSADAAGQMNKLNFRRLMKEFRDAQKEVNSSEHPWLLECVCVDDNLLVWSVAMRFPEESLLQKSLEEFASSQFDETLNKLEVQIRFPVEYPFSPPEVWLRKPRFRYQSAPVTFGGKVCTTLLSSQGWEPAARMTDVIETVRQTLVEAGAEVDISVSRKTGYADAPAVIGLERVRSVMIPQAGDFRKTDVQVLSAAEAEVWVGDVSRLELTDKIMLPFEWASEVYGTDHFQEGMMFEVKTQTGRKVHCALMDFVHGLPPPFVLMPHWVMEDVFIEERDLVSIRAVQLELCTYVKIQPHSVEFYEAVQKSGLDALTVLKETLSRFSGLTVDTSVPIEVGDGTYNVHIVDLQPAGAVKLIAHGSFEAKVDFEPAPDLENEQERKEREQALIQRFKARQEQAVTDKASMQERREAALKHRFERVQKAAIAKAGADNGSEGDVEIACRLPGGTTLKGKFRQGVSASALYALVWASEWATQTLPWDLQLSIAFPRKVLKDSDVIGTDIKHREMVNVREEKPSETDLEEMVAQEEPPQKVAATEVEYHLDEHEVPLDEEKILQNTTEAFELQRLLRAGVEETEAMRRVTAGEFLPPDAVQASGGTALTRAASGRAQENAAAAAERRARQAEEAAKMAENDAKVEQVIAFSGVPRHVAQNFLEKYGWDVQRSINEILEQVPPDR